MIGDTQVTICNGALAALGEAPLPDTTWPLTSVSKAATWCTARYDPCRREVLRQHLWNFAHTQVQITASATPTVFGYGYAFPLPADFLRFWDEWDDDDVRFKMIGWKIVGQNIITNDSGPLNLDYVNDFQTPAQMDALFVQCLSLRLAAEIALPLTQSESKRQAKWQEYNALLPDARLVSSQENSAQQFDDDIWLAARWWMS